MGEEVAEAIDAQLGISRPGADVSSKVDADRALVRHQERWSHMYKMRRERFAQQRARHGRSRGSNKRRGGNPESILRPDLGVYVPDIRRLAVSEVSNSKFKGFPPTKNH